MLMTFLPRRILHFYLAWLLWNVPGLLGCDIVPEDTELFETADPYTTELGPSVGKVPESGGQCPEGLISWWPSECRVHEGSVLTGGPGQLPGERCDADNPCVTGAFCQSVTDIPLCSAECSADSQCPGASVCWLGGGCAHGWCVQPGGLVGADCKFETDCAPGLFCENRTTHGYCTRECGSQSPCPDGMGAICTRLSGGAGNLCLKGCHPGQDECRLDTSCEQMELADDYVCEPTY